MSGWKFITAPTKELMLDVKYLLILASNDSNNAIYNNYKSINNDLACTVGYLNEEPVTVSFIHDKPAYNGMLRILSRFYYTEGLHINHYKDRRFVRPSTQQMLDQQINYCQTNGCDDVFFSREDKTPYIMRRFCKAIDFNTNEYKYIVSTSEPQYVGWRGQLCLKRSDQI